MTAAPAQAALRRGVRDRTGLVSREVVVPAALAVLFAVVVTITWRKWGTPEIDAGAELSSADLVANGATPYLDVRYFYGPLGLYSLAGTFKLFGTSFTTVYVFGLAQAAAILAVFYGLARHWLRPLTAGLSTAVLLAIGFSGTAFNFVLPHTNSATFGILCLLLMLLALTRERLLFAGIAAGLVGLTRPEYVAVAGLVVVAYAFGVLRTEGRRPALSALARLAAPAIVIPVAVLGALASAVGTERLLTDNLWPVDFIREAGFRSQSDWMPLDLESAIGLLARTLVYGGLLAGAIASAVQMAGARGLARVRAAWPLAAAVGGLVLLAGAARVLDISVARTVENETTHMLIGMSWLPALGFAAAAFAVRGLIRRDAPPLGGSWPVDLALIVCAAALGGRAYNAFTTEASYAPYYAAPLVLLLGILHQRIGERWPAGRALSHGALALVAAGLLSYSIIALYGDRGPLVHTPRGTYAGEERSATAIQGAVNAIDRNTRPGDSVLAGPADAGLYFMTGRRPATYELMLLPGLLDTTADERAAIAALRRQHVRLAIIGSRDMAAFGPRSFGRDYNRVLGDFIRSHTSARATVGEVRNPASGTYPTKGYTVSILRGE